MFDFIVIIWVFILCIKWVDIGIESYKKGKLEEAYQSIFWIVMLLSCSLITFLSNR